MDEAVRTDIEARLTRYLATREGYGDASYVAAGGSAALFKVASSQGLRAIKVYDPKFLSGLGSAAEHRRLELQRTLIGHECPSLVQYHRVEAAEGTAFVEMDFVDAPQMKAVLSSIPDSAIHGLINQLVDAVEYLEGMGIVHRDIKPENIHVSADFTTLTLIDLGVARELGRPFEDGPDSTDHGQKRPFIATAQYSSPEYLFRLNEPTPDLWRALSTYQVGGVLHDLINKRPLFQNEVDSGNRWLVARAVLLTVPAFPDANPHRLLAEKALAARCLTKAIETRLATVRWADFRSELLADPMANLATKLRRGGGLMPGDQAMGALNNRMEFERLQYLDGVANGIRRALTPVCATQLSFVLVPVSAEQRIDVTFDLPRAVIRMTVRIEWSGQASDRQGHVRLSAAMAADDSSPTVEHALCGVSLDGGQEEVVTDIARTMATCLSFALDAVATVSADEEVPSMDLIMLCKGNGQQS